MIQFKTILILLLTSILLTTPVWGAGGIQATPADFKYNLNRGEHHTNTITIINTGNTPLQVEILPKKLHINNNNLQYNNNGIATWIQLQKNKFTLKPRQKQIIPFKITIPQA